MLHAVHRRHFSAIELVPEGAGLSDIREQKCSNPFGHILAVADHVPLDVVRVLENPSELG